MEQMSCHPSQLCHHYECLVVEGQRPHGECMYVCMSTNAIMACTHRFGSLVLGTTGLVAVEMGVRVTLCGGGLDADRRCAGPLPPCVHALSASLWNNYHINHVHGVPATNSRSFLFSLYVVRACLVCVIRSLYEYEYTRRVPCCSQAAYDFASNPQPLSQE